MVPKKILVSFKGVNRLYPYYDDQHDLSPGDVVYVEGKRWQTPGQVQETMEADQSDRTLYNHILEKVVVDIHGTYYSYGPYMFCFDREAVSFQQFKSWVSPPERALREVKGDGFTLFLDELGYCEFASEEALERGMRYFQDERVEFLSLIEGKGTALVKDERWHTVTFTYDEGKMQGVVCQSEVDRFCEHAVVTCLTLRTLLQVVQNEFPNQYSGVRFTAVNRELFYQIAAYSLKKITL